jgi:hypothetical protein
MDCVHTLSTKIINSDEWEVIKYTTWALTNLVRGKSINKSKESYALVPLLKVIMNYDCEESILEALCGVNEIMQDVMVSTLIEAQVLPRLYTLANRGSTQCLFTICQILAHVSYGSFEESNTIIEAGFLPLLFNVLKSKTHSAVFKKEVLWTISNLTVGELSQIKAVLSDIDRFNTLMAMCQHDNENVRKEAIWALCNVTSKGGRPEIDSLVQNGILAMFQFNLNNDSHSDVLKTILEALDNILDVDEDEWDRSNDHPLIDLIEDSGLMDTLENLLQHPETEVYNYAIKIIDNYFDVEDAI